MILVDTNVVSEGLRPAPSRQVLLWLNANFEDCAISSITVLELEVAVQMLPSGRRRERLQSAVALAIDRFRPRILPFDDNAARAAAGLFGLAKSKGLSIQQLPLKLADLQLAAIAVANDCALATRDASDLRGLGIDLIDPWSYAASSSG
ncbi:MAG: PIN domain-containing protein [Alphaproteobacteria bacterium]|nr:PIN domain-containing protein [Alphaproteobacteria bacterium]MBV8409142.1 PIN domain-containing protein [Alphaproteobacteria bacterium]